MCSLNKKYNINNSMKQKLMLLCQILIKSNVYKWEYPIANMVPKNPTATTVKYSSLHAAEGYSLELSIYWRIQWPTSIQKQTIKFVTMIIKLNYNKFLIVNNSNNQLHCSYRVFIANHKCMAHFPHKI